MNCPFCSGAMREGSLCGRNGVVWRPRTKGVVAWLGHHFLDEVALSVPFFCEPAPAWYCEHCRKIVAEVPEDPVNPSGPVE